jgi:hypothetical protein
VDLADDEAERTRMSKLGRARVEDELAWPHQEKAYLAVYERIAPQASGTAPQASGTAPQARGK